MTWVRVDDAFCDHPKIDGLTDAAFRLHVAAMCHSARFLTDGFIEASRVARLVRRYKPALAAELVAAGAWDAAPDGWVVHDYTDWNPTADQVRDVQAKRAAAGSKGGSKRQANARASATAKRKQPGKQTSSTNPSYIETPNGVSGEVPEVEPPKRRLARLHWESTSPQPVLRGGFPALMGLCGKLIDAGYDEPAILDALDRTKAYTLDSLQFTLNEGKNGTTRKPQGASVLDAAAARMVGR